MFTLVVLLVAAIVVGVMTGYLRLTTITLDPQNRMLRAGFGKHDGFWFARVDLWSVGFRITRA